MTAQASPFLFVYGSLRSGFQSAAYEYISRYFNFLGSGTVKGKLFDTGEFPAGTPSADDSTICGELYVIKNENEFSWALAQLDDYEGVVAEANEQPLYRREPADVLLRDGTIIKAWVYWYNGEVKEGQVIASGDIMDYWKKKDQAR